MVPRWFCCIVVVDAIIADRVADVDNVVDVATNGARLLPKPALILPCSCPDETNASTNNNEPRECRDCTSIDTANATTRAQRRHRRNAVVCKCDAVMVVVLILL